MINKEEGDIDDKMTLKMKKQKDTNITTMKLKLFANDFQFLFVVVEQNYFFYFDKEVLLQKHNGRPQKKGKSSAFLMYFF